MWPIEQYTEAVEEVKKLRARLAEVKASEARLAEVCDTMVRVFVDTVSVPGPPSIKCADLTQWEPALEKAIRALMARPNHDDELADDQSSPCTHQET